MAQELPTSPEEREALREKGQFWTPGWVARAMAAYVLADRPDALFDPAVGEAAFFRAAEEVAGERGMKIELTGTELDPEVLANHRSDASRLPRSVEVRDFVLDAPSGPYNAIVANPPYIRHHRLDPSAKAQLQALSARALGSSIDARAGLHIYFLIQALLLLSPGGRLAFIMPSDTCEGIFADDLWRWICSEYRLEAVATFAPDATPFPGVDTNPLIFFIRNIKPADSLIWARCKSAGGRVLRDWVEQGFPERDTCDLLSRRRSLDEGLRTGLSRAPQEGPPPSHVLGDYAHVLRGIATGANSFFFLTRQEVADLGIEREFTRPAIARTRDVPGDEVDGALLDELDAAGRPTLLVCPDGRPLDEFPPGIRSYLKRGREMGLPERSLIGSRNPWYKMEKRDPPPFLFAYLGRRNVRFIRNRADIVPLTGFLCVYVQDRCAGHIGELWSVLRAPRTAENLRLVGKSYGGGAIKVEPRALEQLPLPDDLVEAAGLPDGLPQQERLFA